MTHEPQPSPLWSRSGCLRGHTNGVLSREGILALQRWEDIKLVDIFLRVCAEESRVLLQISTVLFKLICDSCGVAA